MFCNERYPEHVEFDKYRLEFHVAGMKLLRCRYFHHPVRVQGNNVFFVVPGSFEYIEDSQHDNCVSNLGFGCARHVVHPGGSPDSADHLAAFCAAIAVGARVGRHT